MTQEQINYYSELMAFLELGKGLEWYYSLKK